MTARRPMRAEHRQHDFRVRFGWGPHGLRALAPLVDVVVVVDVLSFSTCVDVAVDRGAVVLPYRWHNGTEHDYAAEQQAVVASAVRGDGLSLSPSSLTDIAAGTRLVLPSPNGSALTFAGRESGAGAVAASATLRP